MHNNQIKCFKVYQAKGEDRPNPLKRELNFRKRTNYRNQGIAAIYCMFRNIPILCSNIHC